MSSPVLSAVGAFLIGILFTVLVCQSGFIGGPFIHRRFHPGNSFTENDPGDLSLLVSVIPYSGTQNLQCPPVFEISNDTDSVIYFQPEADPMVSQSADNRESGDDESDAQSDGFSDENAAYQGHDGQRDPGGGYLGPPNSISYASGDEEQPIFVSPGSSIATDNNTGKDEHRSRYGCPRNVVHVWVSN